MAPRNISGPYQVQEGWPQIFATASGPRRMDLWRRARHLRRESEPRVPARRRRTANIPRPTTRYSAWGRSEVQFPIAGLPGATPIPPRRRAMAARARIPRRDGSVERNRAALSRAGHRCALGALHRRRQRARQDHAKSGRSGTIVFKRPHSIYISPYDPEKHALVVDDHTHHDLQIHQ